MRAGRRIAVAAVLGIVAALVPPFYAAAAASALYVGGAGCSDSGPGTQAQPFCTISKAAAVATAGQTVLVSSGTYTEDVTPANSGTAGNPITFQAAPGATATITGAADAFTISGRSWITISGFTITGTTSSGIYLSSASNITVSGNRVTASGQRVQGANAVGIYVGGTSNSTISGNTVDNNSATGIYLTQGSTGVTVQGNEASFNAYGWERNANGIDVRAPGNTIIKNVVHDNEDSGIQFYPGGNNNVAADNLSYHNMGITTVQLVNCDHPTTGNTSDCFTGDHGIDDLAVTGNQITGNTVYANKTAGINVEGIPAGTPSGFVIKNNVSVDNAINCPDGAGGTTTCPATKGNIRVDSTSGTGTVLDRDVMWLDGPGYMATWGNTSYRTLSAFQAASGQEPNGKQSNPGFVNPSAGNFQLTAGSPAIDMADSGAVGEQSTDIAGQPRVDDPSTPNTGVGPRTYDDAGAYEYQAPPAAPTLQAAANAASVTLTWSGPPPGTPAIDTYTIYRGTSPGSETQLATVSGPTTQYTDSAVTVGTAYYYQITATNSNGTSARSAETSATPGGAAASPIAFRAASQTSITSGVTQASIGAPAGVQPGDVMVAWLALGSPVTGFTFGSGWTPFSWSPVTDGTAYQVFGYYKVATSADAGATYTASWTGSAKGAFTIAAYSGVDNAAPLAGSAALVDNNSSASLTTPSLAPSASGSWAVALYSIRSTTSTNKNSSWTPDPALTERVDANNSAAASSPWVAVEVADSASAVGTSASSYTATAAFAESHKAAALIYLRQAPGGGGSASPSPSPSPSSSPSSSPSPPSSSPSSSPSPSPSPSPSGTAASPIAFRAASQTSITSGVTQASIGAPAGVQPGDVMVAWLALGSPVTGFTFGSGWTPFTWSPVTDGTTYQVFGYYKVATAADAGATYTANWTTTSKGTFTIAAYSGVDNAAPLAGSAARVNNTSSATLTTPSLAPSAPGSWAVALYSICSSTSTKSNNSWTPDPALTERVDANNSAAASSRWVAVEVADSASAVGTSAGSYTATAAFAESHKAATLIYLQPAAG